MRAFLHILQISQSSHFGKCVQMLCLFSVEGIILDALRARGFRTFASLPFSPPASCISGASGGGGTCEVSSDETGGGPNGSSACGGFGSFVLGSVATPLELLFGSMCGTSLFTIRWCVYLPLIS